MSATPLAAVVRTRSLRPRPSSCARRSANFSGSRLDLPHPVAPRNIVTGTLRTTTSLICGKHSSTDRRPAFPGTGSRRRMPGRTSHKSSLISSMPKCFHDNRSSNRQDMQRTAYMRAEAARLRHKYRHAGKCCPSI